VGEYITELLPPVTALLESFYCGCKCRVHSPLVPVKRYHALGRAFVEHVSDSPVAALLVLLCSIAHGCHVRGNACLLCFTSLIRQNCLWVSGQKGNENRCTWCQIRVNKWAVPLYSDVYNPSRFDCSWSLCSNTVQPSRAKMTSVAGSEWSQLR